MVTELYRELYAPIYMGKPTLWESGGAFPKGFGGGPGGGRARLITGPNGEKLTPLRVWPPREWNACGEHAQFAIYYGCLVIEVVWGFERGARASVWRVVDIKRNEYLVNLAHLYREYWWDEIGGWQGVGWDRLPLSKLTPALEAAWAKSKEPWCSRPYWVRSEDETGNLFLP